MPDTPSKALYASTTSRVFRVGGKSGGGDRTVCKEYIGAPGLRLEREKAALARLAGVRGVVQLAEDNYPPHLLAMRDCGGIALPHAIGTAHFSIASLIPLAIQLARTAADIHRAGVIHRDITPSNVLLTPTGQTELIDFDQAVFADQPHTCTDGEVVGSLVYQAPELSGRTGRPVDHRADLYGLGATLYRMATGRPPFESADALQLAHDQLLVDPQAPAAMDDRIPQMLSSIVLRLLAKEPDHRYQSAEGLLHDLMRLQESLAGEPEPSFELGLRDFPTRLTPGGLVGRQAETTQLAAAFADVVQGAARTVLIEGAGGVGKSALVQQLRPLVAAAGGWFVSGKFDQYHRGSAAAGAAVQALGALARLLLAQNETVLAIDRQRILQKLGRQAVLIGQAVPEFSCLLGEQPHAADIDPTQVEARLVQTMADLLGAVVSPGRPLVIVLDDLQWAGVQSLRIFERWMSECELKGLLLIGAYRGSEPGSTQLLEPMLHRWRALAPPPLHLCLGNLPPADVDVLIARLLRVSPGRARELGDAMAPQAAGNPFDTLEMVNALRREGVLQLLSNGWQWEPAAVRRFASGGTVVDLLAVRIALLPAECREALECMSCLGGTVERDLLATAAGVENAVLAEHLRAPLDDGLLVAERDWPGSVQFRHDRVQQAVLAGLSETARAARHLAMARRLVGVKEFRPHAAQQYLGALRLIPQATERRSVASLFLDVARRLVEGAAFALADSYLAAGLELLDRCGDAGAAQPRDAQLRSALSEAHHRTLYSLGRWAEADAAYAALREGMTDGLALIEPTCLQLRSMDIRGTMQAGLELACDVLGRLGLHVPPGYDEPANEARLDSLADWVRRDAALDARTRAQITDPRLLAIAKLLSRMARSAHFASDRKGDAKALVWAVLESQKLWAEHGPCPAGIASLIRVPAMMARTRQDYRTAYEIACHTVATGKALGYEPQTSESRHIMGTFAGHWFLPVEDCVREIAAGREGMQAWGDPSYASYANASYIELLMDCVPHIGGCDIDIEAGLAMSRRLQNDHAHILIVIERQLLRALRGRTRSPGSLDDDDFDEADQLGRMGRLPFVAVIYEARRALAAALFGDTPALMRHSEAGFSVGGFPSHYLSLHDHLLRALALAWHLQELGAQAAQASPLRKDLEAIRGWLAARVADYPAGFAHLGHLVDAEEAWAAGDTPRACKAFDQALRAAEASRRPWQQALITERAALFHIRHGMEYTGRSLLSQACLQYEDWGASGKTQAMRREHPWLCTQGNAPALVAAAPAGSAAVSADALDLMGLLRASQALSSETSLPRLAASVTKTLAAIAGATRVRVLSRHDEQWWLLAPGPDVPSLPLHEAAAQALLPMSAFAYAERTGEPLLVNDALEDDRFAREPYFKEMPHCSLLVAPIASQGAVRGMLLLENHRSRSAFGGQRLDAVMLIAGQLAVSLANAQLYESLEQRVLARTHELQATQAKLVDAARRAGKAEIANNVLHNVGNVLNSVTVSASIVRRTTSESRIRGLAAAVDLLNLHAQDLGGFMTDDPRGKVTLAYLGKLVTVFEAERAAVAEELTRLTRSVAHVREIVQTQQSHAGPSSIRALARLDDVIEEATHLTALAVAERQARFVHELEDLPPIPLDKSRVLQILVNLISNAADAVSGAAHDARTITLAAGLRRGESGERLRITVRDSGEGIAAGNLTRIFSHGFTTRSKGHGFGLHSSAVAAMEMGGELTAHSEGAGHGALFVLDLPLPSERAGP